MENLCNQEFVDDVNLSDVLVSQSDNSDICSFVFLSQNPIRLRLSCIFLRIEVIGEFEICSTFTSSSTFVVLPIHLVLMQRTFFLSNTISVALGSNELVSIISHLNH